MIQRAVNFKHKSLTHIVYFQHTGLIVEIMIFVLPLVAKIIIFSWGEQKSAKEVAASQFHKAQSLYEDDIIFSRFPEQS